MMLAVSGWLGGKMVYRLMGGYLLVRSAAIALRPGARATLDNTALMWPWLTIRAWRAWRWCACRRSWAAS
jgi:hypothetical protein